MITSDYPIHCASNAWWGWRAQNGGVCGEPLLSSGVWIKKCSDSLWGQKKETNATTFSVALGKTSFFECSCACACFLFFYLFLKKRPSTLLQILDSCYKRRGSGREKKCLGTFLAGHYDPYVQKSAVSSWAVNWNEMQYDQQPTL